MPRRATPVPFNLGPALTPSPDKTHLTNKRLPPPALFFQPSEDPKLSNGTGHGDAERDKHTLKARVIASRKLQGESEAARGKRRRVSIPGVDSGEDEDDEAEEEGVEETEGDDAGKKELEEVEIDEEEEEEEEEDAASVASGWGAVPVEFDADSDEQDNSSDEDSEDVQSIASGFAEPIASPPEKPNRYRLGQTARNRGGGRPRSLTAFTSSRIIGRAAAACMDSESDSSSSSSDDDDVVSIASGSGWIAALDKENKSTRRDQSKSSTSNTDFGGLPCKRSRGRPRKHAKVSYAKPIKTAKTSAVRSKPGPSKKARSNKSILLSKKCHGEGCKADAVRAGLCVQHGANLPAVLPFACLQEGCVRAVERNGACVEHGGEKKRNLCSVEGCTTKCWRRICETHRRKQVKAKQRKLMMTKAAGAKQISAEAWFSAIGENTGIKPVFQKAVAQTTI